MISSTAVSVNTALVFGVTQLKLQLCSCMPAKIASQACRWSSFCLLLIFLAFFNVFARRSSLPSMIGSGLWRRLPVSRPSLSYCFFPCFCSTINSLCSRICPINIFLCPSRVVQLLSWRCLPVSGIFQPRRPLHAISIRDGQRLFRIVGTSPPPIASQSLTWTTGPIIGCRFNRSQRLLAQFADFQ